MLPPLTSSSPAISRSRVDLPARGADEDHELLVVHLKVDALDDVEAFEAFLQVVDFQVSHGMSPQFQSYFTAPKDRPRTNCFWLIQPKIRIGAQARVETAESLAQNSPSGLE